jgi:uncharacterized protein YfaT (DUF1175 family)
LLACLVVGVIVASAYHLRSASALAISVDHDFLPANGYAEARLRVNAGLLGPPHDLTWRIESGRNLAEVESSSTGARLRAGVTPGIVTLAASAPGFRPARMDVRLGLDLTDEFGDGTPDFLRLQDLNDRIAFRRWFTFLAESTYFQQEQERPAEVEDCAALIRFAYREALRRHDAAWANSWHLLQLPEVGSVHKYEYPHTALGAALFRTQPGAFAADDIANGTFAEFADAESLRRYNTYLVSREMSAARPGDLLFFRQQGHRMPFHTMIFLGNSSFTGDDGWLIYHTGPGAEDAGEIRRVTVRELLQHPEFGWRPLPQNPAFLGIYRWNILREED